MGLSLLDRSSSASGTVWDMHGGQDAGTAASVRRVFARVDLQATALAELKRRGAGRLRGVLVTSGKPER